MPNLDSATNTSALDQETEIMIASTEEPNPPLEQNGTEEESDSDNGDAVARDPSSDAPAQDRNKRGSTRYTSTDWDRSGDEVNEEMMYRSVSKAGLWAYGISGVEVWVFNEENNTLERPDGGYWRDPVFEPSEALNRIEDRSRADYVPPKPLGPGQGLAGALWAEVRDPRSFLSVMADAFGKPDPKPTTQNRSGNDIENNLQNMDRGKSLRDLNEDYVKVSWRSVKLLATDPEQPPNERLKLLSEAGFGLAAGATFDVRGHRGIVVYMARPTVDTERLQSITNEVYMRNAADLIGAESALSKARIASIETRKAERKAAFRRCKLKLRLLCMAQKHSKLQGGNSDAFIDALQAKLEDIKDEAANLDKPAALVPARPSIADKVKTWAKKSTGMHVNPPPPMPVPQAIWTFFGCFITMAILITVFKEIARVSNGQYKVPLPIYASLMTLHYGLTGSPAGQPRNMLYGKFYGMSVALILGYLINGALAPWIHLSLVTAIVVSGMMLLSITHPPASSVAIIFASGGRTWVDLGLVLMADCITIAVSAIINNISSKRQYPVYWGFLQWEVFECIPCARTKQIEGAEPILDSKGNTKLT